MKLTEIIKELSDLASSMEAQTTTAQAKAAELCLHKEPAQAAIYERKATRGRHYAEVLRNAVRILRSKEKRGAFVAPTFPELLEYAKTAFPAWPKSDLLSWWNHFESVGWVIGKGKHMVDWKRAAANGFRNWTEKSPANGRVNTPANGKDPDGWREYLVKAKRPYTPYQYEIECVRRDFDNSKGK